MTQPRYRITLQWTGEFRGDDHAKSFVDQVFDAIAGEDLDSPNTYLIEREEPAWVEIQRREL